MILVLGGTSESRTITRALSDAGYQVMACSATPYGSFLLNNTVRTFTGRLEVEGIIELIRAQEVKIVIDATHPFAEKVKVNAREACRQTGSFYIRYDRPDCNVPKHPLVNRVHGYENAAAMASALEGQTIFLTTGTNTLPVFVQAARECGKRIVTRILPGLDGIKLCLDLNIAPADIIAMQGPFSESLNKALFNDYGADILITKDSGTAGGTPDKIKAALALGMQIVVIERPEIKPLITMNKVNGIDQLLTLISSMKGPV